MKNKLIPAFILALVFYVSILPWKSPDDAFGEQYYNYRAKDITGNGAGSITGFSIPLYITEEISVYEALVGWAAILEKTGTDATPAFIDNVSVVPTDNTAACVAGQIAMDSTHIYWCPTDNNWRRAAAEAW